MDDQWSSGTLATQSGEQRSPVKRCYQSPVLMEYGSIEQLVDSGAVGGAPSIVISQ